jgi:hypothetical protein
LVYSDEFLAGFEHIQALPIRYIRKTEIWKLKGLLGVGFAGITKEFKDWSDLPVMH